MASSEAGFAHDLFVEGATDTKNVVHFTERGRVDLVVSTTNVRAI